ncbi:type II toxin-antitoxin system VapC family toxin [Pseudonocardia nigra]|uniref:type II toxin-antitoxin system VapC family toxin n=1 Tax=Pseudonocardia nigra TaxID=1921578 RepID=UPI0027E38AF0|nr:type II toxin-antitoxin system VapC family toxin [Pseudonocardia nigra]
MELTSRLLLDTHALLWTLLDPDRIPARTLDRIRAADTDVLVSAASAWEIGTKYRLGKLGEAHALVYGYGDHLRRLRATELPISSRHALAAGMLTWEHRDPFDRVIAAQCMIESLPLVTTDRALAAFPGVQVVW